MTTASSSGTAPNRLHDGALADDCIARVRALAPCTAAAAPQIEADRESIGQHFLSLPLHPKFI